jgi:uncharacterized protein YkuJ
MQAQMDQDFWNSRQSIFLLFYHSRKVGLSRNSVDVGGGPRAAASMGSRMVRGSISGATPRRFPGSNPTGSSTSRRNNDSETTANPMTANEMVILEENRKTISRLRNVEKDGATMTELGYDHEGRVFVLRKKAAKGPLGYYFSLISSVKMRVAKDDPRTSPTPDQQVLGKITSRYHLGKIKNGHTAQKKADKLAAASATAEFIQDSSLDIITLVFEKIDLTFHFRPNL